jgi:hypothetical protein
MNSLSPLGEVAGRCPDPPFALTPAAIPADLRFPEILAMADHGTVEYATAAGNDYPAHEQSYERFVHFIFVGLIHMVNILLALAVGGVMGHWFVALAMFAIAVVGAIPGLVSGGRTSSYVAFVLCFLIFAFAGIS